jgi:hypothetical protein
MRLFTRTGATALDDPEFGHFEASPDGSFDFPDDLSDRLHSFHWRGQPMWETDIERQQRLVSEEMERRRDPASLYEAVAQLMQAAKGAAVLSAAPAPVPAAVDAAPEAPVAKAPRARKSAAAKSASVGE